MKFQNISIHDSKLMLCTKKQQVMHKKATRLNGQKLQRTITPTLFQLIGWNFNQVISSSVPISIPNIKAVAQIPFEVSWEITRYFISREITLKWEIDWLCWGLTTLQPLRVILCRLPEKGRKEIEERVEEMKEGDREKRGTGMKVKKQKK